MFIKIIVFVGLVCLMAPSLFIIIIIKNDDYYFRTWTSLFIQTSFVANVQQQQQQQQLDAVISIAGRRQLAQLDISGDDKNNGGTAAAAVLLENNNNTHWKNVQYYRGVMQDLSWSEQVHIVEVCKRLSGLRYRNNNNNNNENDFNDGQNQHYPSNNNIMNNNNPCFGPLATNTTCCYCYTSYDYEEISKVDRYKHYMCAVPRNNSLLPLNATRLILSNNHHHRHVVGTTINGSSRSSNSNNSSSNIRVNVVAWVTGKFGYKNRFKKQVKKVCRQVRDMNIILDPKHIHCYWKTPEFVLLRKTTTTEFQRHLRYRIDPNDASARGGGFWFHKSVLLQHHLYHTYQHGDYIVYTDIDRLDFFRLGSFHAVMDTMMSINNKRDDHDDHDDLCMDVIGNTDHATYTKEDMLAAFNASAAVRASPQLAANVIIVRNSPTMKLFVDAWVECMSDWHMVSDEPSVLPTHHHASPSRSSSNLFRENRHDQSVLSLLIHQFMTNQIVVGPPARSYPYLGELVTYKFKEGADPTCPFSEYYFEQYKANAMQLRRSSAE